jgi:hypothetical protein
MQLLGRTKDNSSLVEMFSDGIKAASCSSYEQIAAVTIIY